MWRRCWRRRASAELTVDDKAGSLSQSGPLIVGGSSSFTTEGGNATITLANANNALAGGVALDTTGWWALRA